MLKLSVVLVLMSIATPCFAKVILDCSLEGGDVSALTVKEENGALTLLEIDIDHKTHVREVSAQEWAAKTLELTVLEPGAQSTLAYDQQADAWYLSYRGSMSHFGFMPCN